MRPKLTHTSYGRAAFLVVCGKVGMDFPSVSVTEWKMDQKRMPENHSDSDINEDLTSLVVNVDLGGSLRLFDKPCGGMNFV